METERWVQRMIKERNRFLVAPGQAVSAGKQYQPWETRDDSRDVEDEKAVRDFLDAEGRGLDHQTVRKFVRYWRDRVGPAWTLRPCRADVYYNFGGNSGYAQLLWESDWGVFCEPPGWNDDDGTAAAAAGVEEASAPGPGVGPVTPLAPGVPEPAEMIAAAVVVSPAVTRPAQRSIAAVSSARHGPERARGSESATAAESRGESQAQGVPRRPERRG